MKILNYVNWKHGKFSTHTDSVNKITKLSLNEFFSYDVDIEIILRKTDNCNNRLKRKFFNTYHEIRHQIRRPTGDLIFVVFESEVTLQALICRKPVVLSLHDAEFFMHPELCARSHFTFKERFCHFLITFF